MISHSSSIATYPSCSFLSKSCSRFHPYHSMLHFLSRYISSIFSSSLAGSMCFSIFTSRKPSSPSPLSLVVVGYYFYVTFFAIPFVISLSNFPSGRIHYQLLEGSDGVFLSKSSMLNRVIFEVVVLIQNILLHTLTLLWNVSSRV